MSTTWKTLKFSTFLNKLNIETLDTILFDDGGRNYATSGPIKAFVKKATYNSADHKIDFELELPVKAGEMGYYPFYWPSLLPASNDVAPGRRDCYWRCRWRWDRCVGHWQSAYGSCKWRDHRADSFCGWSECCLRTPKRLRRSDPNGSGFRGPVESFRQTPSAVNPSGTRPYLHKRN